MPAVAKRDREQIPVHRRVQRKRGGEREVQDPIADEQVEAQRDDERRDPQHDRARVEVAGGARARDPGRGPHRPHREHGVLVAFAGCVDARVQVREAALAELLGGELVHVVRVAQPRVLAVVAPLAGRARRLERVTEHEGAREQREDGPEPDPSDGVRHPADYLRARRSVRCRSRKRRRGRRGGAAPPSRPVRSRMWLRRWVTPRGRHPFVPSPYLRQPRSSP